MPNANEQLSAMQRVRVGMTGLAVVLILILLASALVSSARNDAPVVAVGAPNVETVANMTGTDKGVSTADAGREPLAELGIAPAATNSIAPPAKLAPMEPPASIPQ
ncbi:MULTISPECIES: hypothetical protein [Sphingomonas]|uniref:SPOR domain-containing protein n=1 Tax=Sphingomonas molluscorum TaxID=418184 RepID=A0ABU8Q3I5_9SPHN|nr:MULTISPECIES: hypothetical protein [unclassified Sphingomonas]MBM7405829.1 Na+/H+ antiporter NhaD/arsenite permease-like protein [Sphingomonas sp. JUb134]MCG7347504.1 hypothetical protein [Sphingomonas sp. ACRSK]